VLTAANSKGGQKMLAHGHRLEVGKVGIVGFVTATGQPRIALDTGKDAVFFDNPDLPETHSEISLPLRSGNQIIGALDVQSTESNAFGEEDIETLSILADQVGLAIDNNRLFEQTQRALNESELLTRQYMKQEWGRLAESEQLIGFQYNNTTGATPLPEPLNIPDARKAILNGETYNVPGNGSDQPALLAVPIQIRDVTIGVLNIQSEGKTNWNKDQIDLAMAVADRVALSAENARLFEETSRRAERERKVSEITNKIRSTTDPQIMLQTTLDELKRTLGTSEINVHPFPFDPKQD